MAGLVDPIEELFESNEPVRLVPVVSDQSRTSSLGTAYVSTEDIVIHIRSQDLVDTVGNRLSMSGILRFLLGLQYMPAEENKEKR